MGSTGIENILVENGLYGPGVVKSVLSGGNFIRGKRGMLLLAETLQRLQFHEFVTSSPDMLVDKDAQKCVDGLQDLVRTHDPKLGKI